MEVNTVSKILIKNGFVVLLDRIEQKDILIENEKIKMIDDDIVDSDATILNAKGKYVLPGAIDVHTHFHMAFGGTYSSDDYESGSLGALRGGVTTYLDYAILKEEKSLKELIDSKLSLAKTSYVDYGFHIALTRSDDKTLEELDHIRDYGVASLKCFMVYKKENMMISDDQLKKILLVAKKNNLLVNVHAEDVDMIDDNIDRFVKEGTLDNYHHYLSRPEEAEYRGVLKALSIAKEADAPLYIVHNACEDGINAIRQAKQNGQKVFAETCPQYLNFTCDVYKREDAQNYVCSPAIKGQTSQDALWKAIIDHTVDTVATDHCPFLLEEKLWGKNDFRKTPNGCDGIENLYPYMLDKANQGIMTFVDAARLCSSNPAKIFQIPHKGEIKVGNDADLVIYNPNVPSVFHIADSLSNCEYSIWEGYQYSGTIQTVILRGTILMDYGRISGEIGYGKFIKRG